eukprot:GHVR01088796.1.p1 GENE.GHVR01088796.1~~GHVR01088796.1.p1  ORF type:complete len:266 (-),score=46.33 GHVR01088796.1:222-992(-)
MLKIFNISNILNILIVFSLLRVCVCQQGEVLELTSNNFFDFVGGTNYVLVKFYAPWCGHCINMKSDYEQAARAFKNESDIIFAEVDCTKYPELKKEFIVPGYPTMRWFPAGINKFEQYDRGRTLTDFVGFVNDKVGTMRGSSGDHPHLWMFELVERLSGCIEGHGDHCIEIINEVEVSDPLEVWGMRQLEKHTREPYMRILYKEIDRLMKLLDGSMSATNRLILIKKIRLLKTITLKLYDEAEEKKQKNHEIRYEL